MLKFSGRSTCDFCKRFFLLTSSSSSSSWSKNVDFANADMQGKCNANGHIGFGPALINIEPKRKASSEKKSLVKTRENPYAGLTVGEKVKEAGKDTAYTGVIIVGLGVTGLMFYAVGRELFSKQSPSGVYGEAFKLCRKNTEIIAAFGEPIKGYGETTRRGRRRHVSHAEFEVNGVQHMRMKFYIEGPDRKGTVHLEVRKNTKEKYEYRYLIVELDGYPKRTVIVEDNR